MPKRDSVTGQFLPGPKLCACGSGHCDYHRKACQLARQRHQERRRAEARVYYHTHREKMRDQNRIWRRQNKEFSCRRSSLRRRAGARLTKHIFQSLLDYYGPFCVYCSTPTTGIDHLIPLARGGEGNSLFNMAPCCPLCNSIKGTRPIWVMLGQEEVR